MWLLREILRLKTNNVREELFNQLNYVFNKRYPWAQERLLINSNGWDIFLDTCFLLNGQINIPYTRITAQFHNPINLKFKVYKSDIFSRIENFFAIRHNRVNDTALGLEYVIIGNYKDKICKLFSTTNICDLIKSQPSIYLRIIKRKCITNPQENISELLFLERDVIRSQQRLEKLIELFVNILNQLEEMGIALKTSTLPHINAQGSVK